MEHCDRWLQFPDGQRGSQGPYGIRRFPGTVTAFAHGGKYKRSVIARGRHDVDRGVWQPNPEQQAPLSQASHSLRRYERTQDHSRGEPNAYICRAMTSRAVQAAHKPKAKRCSIRPR